MHFGPSRIHQHVRCCRWMPVVSAAHPSGAAQSTRPTRAGGTAKQGGEEEKEMNDHDEILRMMLRAIAAKMIARLGDINIADHIKPAWFLQMPNADSLLALGDAAKHFRDGDGDPDGDLLLQVARRFSPDELGDGVRAGGQLADGYIFPYPRKVDTNLPGWCAYPSLGVGYARTWEVAAIIWANSIALAKEEDQD